MRERACYHLLQFIMQIGIQSRFIGNGGVVRLKITTKIRHLQIRLHVKQNNSLHSLQPQRGCNPQNHRNLTLLWVTNPQRLQRLQRLQINNPPIKFKYRAQPKFKIQHSKLLIDCLSITYRRKGGDIGRRTGRLCGSRCNGISRARASRRR